MPPRPRRTGTPIRLATLCLIPFAAACGGAAAERPWIAEEISPLEPIAPVAEDGDVGMGYLAAARCTATPHYRQASQSAKPVDTHAPRMNS
jgi:hypothetical protein